ncbi:MAG: hypothetical protein MH321_03915 [Leptospiraceae bacterium]|nr:hypothetical protein [Leptospiraceae bacterium]
MAGLSQENPLKNVFNRRAIEDLSNRIAKVYPSFRKKEFLLSTLQDLESLGFIERSNHLRDRLFEFLPQDPEESIRILMESLGPELSNSEIAALEGFTVMSLCSFVSKFGQNNFDLSMKALYEMTKRFSAEGDLRTFLSVDYEKCMKLLHKWCGDPSHHVRRLVSEGTRPRLPLSGRIPRFQKDPTPVIELLDKLVNDESLYVRRSVANNINDIAKDNPKIAIATLKRWKKNPSEDVQWLVKHASRSLVKSGNSDLLEIFGVKSSISIKIQNFKISKLKFKLNEILTMDFEIESKEAKVENLVIDYVIHFMKANGKTKEKVFKLKNSNIKPKEKLQIQKKHKLIDTAGRTHYPGKHILELQINGKRYGRQEFEMI